MANKKELKILREIKPEFKEIKEEKQEEEILQEDEETQDFESISDFSQGITSATSPTLQSQPLESVLENVPPAETKKAETEERKETGYDPSVYNMPDYTGSYEATGFRRKEAKEAGIMIKPEDISGTNLPRARAEDWHEISEARQGREEMSHSVLKAERLDTGQRLPFEERRKYRKIV